ncbi:hypothetical protein [Actinokineospora enzanensis]|uniref:hypothetical protein n=1 Tax=Actinokineospora enzanensis TaxID=155975 RepID=UPI00035F1261|nr:hypothetical protein [Actinokineospora enzanensis]
MPLLPRRPGTVLEIRRPQPHAVHFTTERGVILHSARNWLVAYFPGDPQHPADPADPAAIRVVGTADVADAIVAYRDLVHCDPAWVLGTWKHLSEAGPGELQAPQVIRIWELAAQLAQHRLDADAASLITHEQLEAWAGRPLTDLDLDRLDVAIPNSSIPAAIGEIVAGLDSKDGREAE